MRTLWLLPTLALACSNPVPRSAPAIARTETATAPAPAVPRPPAPTAATNPPAAQGTPSAPATAAPPSPSAALSIDHGTLPAGTYWSAACGARQYTRFVRLSAPNVITIEDLVSPCPAHAQCMWSGIVVRTGNYTVERGRSVGGPMRVVIDVTPEADSMSKPPPSHLSWWNSRGELTESDEKCRYTREP